MAVGATESRGTADADATPEPGTGVMVNLTSALAEELAANESGLAIIYRALDALVETHNLEDAAIVIEEPNLGRQVFRAGRKVLDEDDEALLSAPAGIYTEPPLPDDELDRSMVNSVCVLALRMDVLRYDAWHDPLTGLDDRRSFDRLLEVAVANSNRYSWAFALVIIDMDLLKHINDRQGHAAGDVALRDLAERMQHTLRYGDSAARIGGDEFAMILPNTEPDAVPPLLERIRARPGLSSEPPEFSYGAAVCPAEAETVAELFELADSRLREHKLERKAQR
jgi:diguanylate cyclase (GGDEF)-like protein